MISFLLLINISLIYSYNFLHKKSINYHSWTKAICDEEYCQDYEISCRNKSVITMTPITGASIKISEGWSDPRTPEEQNRLCE